MFRSNMWMWYAYSPRNRMWTALCITVMLLIGPIIRGIEPLPITWLAVVLNVLAFVVNFIQWRQVNNRDTKSKGKALL